LPPFHPGIRLEARFPLTGWFSASTETVNNVFRGVLRGENHGQKTGKKDE
jgi:hypothetical protein